MKKIREQARETEVKGEYDVLVIGGGPAGISASIAAAQSGARTLLVERYGFLGGMATLSMVGSFCGFFTAGPRKKEIVTGIAGHLLDRLRDKGGLSEKRTSTVNPRIAVYQYDPEIMKCVADETVIYAGVEILFHTLAVDVIGESENRSLSGILVENKSGRSAYLSRTIVDTTGDADVAFKANAPCEFGDGRGKAQSLTTVFRMMNVNPDKLRTLDRQTLGRKMIEAREQGGFHFQRVDPIIVPSVPSGMVTANVTGIPNLNALDAEDVTKAEMEGRRQVFEYLRFFRRSADGFQKAEVSSIAPQVGVRETRRILGEYVLQEHEVLKGQKFNDAIALGAWPVELHNPETGRLELKFLEEEDDYYGIPLGCLIPRGVDNLIVAGRCISATHVAQASTRVIGPALAMGEAAGILASMSAHLKKVPREISAQSIQQELERRGVLLRP